MAAASALPVATPAPAVGPAKPSAGAPPSPPAPPPPLAGEIVDRGSGRRDSVRVLHWTVDGAAKVLGTVEVGTLEASGLLTVGGELLCQELRVRGSLDTFARMQVSGRFEVLGNARLGGPVAVGEAHFSGRAELTAELAATGAVHAEGHLAVAGDLSGSELRFSGTLAVAGAIRAQQIVGTLDGASRARSITCDSIELKRLSFPPWKRTGSFRADRIEAREVHLEGVSCEFLRAEEIHLGPDCHVSRAEGRVVERHRSSYVGYESSSPRPPGLSR